jgi:hypothetical protein
MPPSRIGSNHGAEASRKRLNALDPNKNAHNVMYGEPGKKYAEAPNVPVEGTIRKLIEGHNDYVTFRELMDRRPF